ncbi:NusG domain II-containing protein [Azotosporobacter soli]|uniref:NusG domain II-containing protein n=1 Tax=Azotosporobacter soli TaxID=3055040 RepID=UPI0031FF2937
MLTKADKILIVVLLSAALAGISASFYLAAHESGEKIAEVRVAGQVVKTMTLRQGYREEFTLRQGDEVNVIEADNGRIRIREANCPDHLCVQQGWVSLPNQQLVCLPFRVTVKVTTTESELDDIAR